MTVRDDPLRKLIVFMFALVALGMVLALLAYAAGLVPVHHLAVPSIPVNGNLPLQY